MKFETKFDTGDFVIFIHDNKILRRKIIDFKYEKTLNRITYEILLELGNTMLDKPKKVFMLEEHCFETVLELVEYYKKFIND